MTGGKTDIWGRMLMKRRAVMDASEKNQPTPNLYDIDFLLGVQDESRMGALRFKLDPEGPFLAQDHVPIPPISSIRELQQAANVIEGDTGRQSMRKWLAILLAPGSSLGGARPKANAKEDLPQLWRRIVFHLAVSNTDDHLRNHGFLFTPHGWRLSPAYDLNPSVDKDGLSLNIDMESNALSYDLAFSVGQYFDLDLQAMQGILEQVKSSVRQWRSIAGKAGIRKAEQDMMAGAFRV